MIVLVLLASILIATVTIYQYKEQTSDYNAARLQRKERSIQAAIDIRLEQEEKYPVETTYLPNIFRRKVYEISQTHSVDISIYDLKGRLLITSIPAIGEKKQVTKLKEKVLTELAKSPTDRFATQESIGDDSFQSSYTYITDNDSFKPIGILNVEYLQDNSHLDKELREFLYRLSVVYIVMLVTAIIMAYFISSFITQPLKTITNKMKQTFLDKKNEKIFMENTSTEIHTLIKAYNSMINQIEESAVKLAKSEREQAWREMAKQVAHEIKNPLTPMRLTIQSFERKFDPENPDIKHKLHEFSNSLIQQIDTLSSIASAFSSFAKMPEQNKERLEIVETLKLAIDIFNKSYIKYSFPSHEIVAFIDRTQFIRIITNLVKNAIQATVSKETPKILIELIDDKENIIIKVSDNGIGISEEVKDKVFEPKFTTKSSGMGLGLPMIKNIIETYNGSISFVSEENMGTIFTIILPKK
ncbi:sensor histidine kinase [Aureivirga sp. CE67]|uniref:sensor histidine kinase n=1 Tax=Aureivirga sp. CE67 TaxID=1788983 RepID=UPI001E503D61|nr:HAMP domain-containing sensor histidine kinase [Aureivirga sp. CE67]